MVVEYVEGQTFETFAILTGVFTLLLLVGEARDSQVLRYAFKPVASTFFILAGLKAEHTTSPSSSLATLVTRESYGAAIVAGLCLSWFGDVFLIPKSEAIFKLGLVSFLLGHVAYSYAFFARIGVDMDVLPVAAAPPAIVALGVCFWLLPHVPSPMLGPVLAYIAVITTMVAASIAVFLGSAGSVYIPTAAVVFFVSDLCVARQKFVAPSLINRLIGLPLYYGSQLVFAYSILHPKA